jgi:hypothetical protein
MVELIELEGMGHHTSDSKAIVLPALCRLYEQATSRDKGREEDFPVTVAEPQPQAESESENKKRKVEQWGRWRRGDAALEELGLSEAETRAAVLVDIQLCMEGLSPLTCGKAVGQWELGKEKEASTGGAASESPRILVCTYPLVTCPRTRHLDRGLLCILSWMRDIRCGWADGCGVPVSHDSQAVSENPHQSCLACEGCVCARELRAAPQRGRGASHG